MNLFPNGDHWLTTNPKLRKRIQKIRLIITIMRITMVLTRRKATVKRGNWRNLLKNRRPRNRSNWKKKNLRRSKRNNLQTELQHLPRNRSKIVLLLAQALGDKDPNEVLDPQDVARDIEAALWEKYKDKPFDYKTKFRSISFNLKNPKSPELRASVIGGIISPSQLVCMTPQEMASDELKKERQRISDWHLEAAKLIQMNQTSTDMFKCGKCGKRETTYYQLQTRSADEPMTTFHTCTFCGNRWKS